VPGLRANIGHASQDIPRHLPFDGQVPTIRCRYFVVAAGIVANRDFVKRWAVRKVSGRRERTGESWVEALLRTVAQKRRLSSRELAERIAEGTWACTRTRTADAGGREYELRAKGPLVYEAIAEGADYAAVIEDASPTANAGFAVTKYVPGEADTGSEGGEGGRARHYRACRDRWQSRSGLRRIFPEARWDRPSTWYLPPWQ